MIKRIVIAGAAGAAACYLLDSQHGHERRKRLVSSWREGWKATFVAGHHATRTLEPITPLPEMVLKTMERGRTSAKPKMVAIGIVGLIAVVSGGVLRYLTHPTHGRTRQEGVGKAWAKYQSAQALSGLARPGIDSSPPEQRPAPLDADVRPERRPAEQRSLANGADTGSAAGQERDAIVSPA